MSYQRSDNFERAMRFVAKWEGGFVDHPNDPGGATNMGVTQRTYDAWRDKIHARRRDVKKLDPVERDAIYHDLYWVPAGCDKLPWPLALVHFDTAVNTGVGRANKFLEQTQEDVALYISLREKRYNVLCKVNPKLSVFLRGWLNRLNDLEAECSRS